MISQQSAHIVIDSGFSEDSLSGASKVAGFYDLPQGSTVTGAPWVDQDSLNTLSGDPMYHGSIVLKKIRELSPDAPLVLIRAFNDDGRLIRTGWEHGRPASNGWTEAYIWAVELCQRLGFTSVANASFGGFTHAMDGTGWESFQLGRVVGPSRAGHIFVAAAGPGDGRAEHASWTTLSGEETVVDVYQRGPTRYNFWTGFSGKASDDGDWRLEVWKDNRLVKEISSDVLAENFWNHHKQVTFTVDGEGLVFLALKRTDTAGGAHLDECKFECWIDSDGAAAFLNHVDPELICEPAIFPQVLAVGLHHGSYTPGQWQPGSKPEVLVPGSGPISFRLPEVTAAVGRLLSRNPSLDVVGAAQLLGKHPRLSI